MLFASCAHFDLHVSLFCDRRSAILFAVRLSRRFQFCPGCGTPPFSLGARTLDTLRGDNVYRNSGPLQGSLERRRLPLREDTHSTSWGRGTHLALSSRCRWNGCASAQLQRWACFTTKRFPVIAWYQSTKATMGFSIPGRACGLEWHSGDGHSPLVSRTLRF